MLTVITIEVGVEDAPQVVNDSLHNTCLVMKTDKITYLCRVNNEKQHCINLLFYYKCKTELII